MTLSLGVGRELLTRELAVAVHAARAAGTAAMKFYGRSVEAEMKAGNSPVTAADHASNAVILSALAGAFPGDAILSEETRDSEARLSAERLWIVDPLDGTKEFLTQNGEFSVMIGLVEMGEPIMGVVYRPDGDVLYAAVRGSGAWVERNRERRPLRARTRPPKQPIRLVGSRSHPDPLLVRIQEALGIADVRPSGSVGIKCALIAEGLCDLYIHPVPYLKEWDTCAPELVLREAGGRVTDCTGTALLYNKLHPAQPDGILASAPGVEEEILEQAIALYAAHARRVGSTVGGAP